MAVELKDAYAEKGEDYFEFPRPEMAALFPAGAKRILDVGCGAGTFGAQLKQKHGCEVWGVEPDEKSFQKIGTKLDHAYHGFFDAQAGLPENHFDGIFFNDVLEHMVEPAAALQLAKKLLAPGGRIISSIPNIRHFPTLWRLVFRGEWQYAERGILDRTHLRFFTRSSIAELFAANGLNVVQLTGINEYLHTREDDQPIWKYYRYVSRLPNRHFHDLRYLQFAVVAEAGK